MQEVNAVAKRPSETEQAMVTVLGEALVALVPVPGDCADAVLLNQPARGGLVAKTTHDTTDEERAVRRFGRATCHRHRRASGRLGADRGTSVGRSRGGCSPGLCRLGLAVGEHARQLG